MRWAQRKGRPCAPSCRAVAGIPFCPREGGGLRWPSASIYTQLTPSDAFPTRGISGVGEGGLGHGKVGV